MKVGIDLVKVKRLVNIVNKLDKPNHIFNASEIEYINSKRGKLDGERAKIDGYIFTAAGIFAAKEAVLKALGVGVNNGTALTDVEIGHTKLGEPTVKLKNKAKLEADKQNIDQINVSISHDGEYSTAISVIL